MSEPKFVVTAKDLEVTWFRGKGKGGQHRNKHANCCRIRHPETGVIVTGQDHKERPRNRKDALKKLVAHPKFRWFCEQGLRAAEGRQTVEEAVEEAMKPENLEWSYGG